MNKRQFTNQWWEKPVNRIQAYCSILAWIMDIVAFSMRNHLDNLQRWILTFVVIFLAGISLSIYAYNIMKLRKQLRRLEIEIIVKE